MDTFVLTEKESTMGKRPTYPPEIRHKILELVRSGRSVNAVAREFEVARQSIVNWQKQDDLDTGRRSDGLTTDEHTELVHLRREIRRLKMEAEILSKAADNSTGQRNASFSVLAGVLYCKVFRGRWFSLSDGTDILVETNGATADADKQTEENGNALGQYLLFGVGVFAKRGNDILIKKGTTFHVSTTQNTAVPISTEGASPAKLDETLITSHN